MQILYYFALQRNQICFRHNSDAMQFSADIFIYATFNAVLCTRFCSLTFGVHSIIQKLFKMRPIYKKVPGRPEFGCYLILTYSVNKLNILYLNGQ
jgi:hypothetical protein